MNLDKDSVINFLTPTKLVHGWARPKPRVNLNESRGTNSSNRQRLQGSEDIPPYSFTVQFDKLNQQTGKSRNLGDDIVSNTNKEKSKPPADRHNDSADLSKGNNKSEDNFKLVFEDKYEVKQASKPVFQMQPVQYSPPPPPVGEILAKINNSQKSSRVQQSRGLQKQRSREEYHPFNAQNKNVFKLQGTVEELNNLMDALKEVKNLIDFELGELQLLLDNTSKYLNDRNQQYLRVKQRILDYTSQVLDASFSRYQENMVNWMKYEDAEKKALAILAQLDKTIIEDEIIVKEMSRASSIPRVAVGKQQQMVEKIQFYGNFANQVKAIRAECVSMRPQLKKSKVIQFEKALAAMAQF